MENTSSLSTETILLLGASGKMGFPAFIELWRRRITDGRLKYKNVLLQRPSNKNKKLFKPYEKESGVKSISGKGVVQNNGFKIVWGDATVKEDIFEACKDVDWILNALAMIPPDHGEYLR